MEKKYTTFREFYPFYLSQHVNRTCRVLHFVGTWLIVGILAAMFLTRAWQLAWLIPLVGYGFAWVGHFFFEKNRPATFTYPLYSLMGDWVMWWQLLTRRIRFS